MDDKKMPKNAEVYCCELCDFKCCKRSNYDKHILTLKHKKRTNGGQMDDALHEDHIYDCVCGNEYKHRQGLWKHKQNCEYIKNAENAESLTLLNEQNEVKILTELVKDVIKQNQDLTNKLVDICKNNSKWKFGA